jgi:hypothetical protein
MPYLLAKLGPWPPVLLLGKLPFCQGNTTANIFRTSRKDFDKMRSAMERIVRNLLAPILCCATRRSRKQ